MSKALADSLVGSTLGDKYAIEAFLGEGAMGSVYRAHHASLRKTVAIKVLHRHLAEQPTFVERFQREAHSASLLDHPNSLRVLDFGQSDGLLYLVMEFAQGEDLLTVMLRDWPLDDRRVVDVMSQALAALATAHDIGLVHRDLKPENILLLRGTDDEGKPIDVVKVCDFGIAKLMSRADKTESFARHLTTDGFVIGTPDYMSPEQARGEDLDGRSDLYSMGIVLYQLLSGQLPFVAETPLGVVLRHISDAPVPPSTHAKVNAQLESICMRALNKDPRDRFQNAREMRRALRAAITGSFETSLPPSSAGRNTDMTSVPVSRRADQAKGSGVWLSVRSLRLPTTFGGRAAALLATAAGFAVSLLVMRYLSSQVGGGRAGASANSETVLTVPAPTIADSALVPIAGPAVPDEPVRPKTRSSERSQTESEARRVEKTSVREGTSGSSRSAQAAASANDDAVPSGTSPRAAAVQPPSPSSAETAPRSAAPLADKPVPTASEATAHPAAAPVATPAPSPTAPSAALDPSRASVAVGTITTTGGISVGKVRVSIARIPFTSCYRKALVNRTSAAPMEASLRITVDMSGRVTGATLSSDGGLPGLRACIESEARGLVIRDVDTGDGSAVVSLAFAPQ